jgi:hypothetical protein
MVIYVLVAFTYSVQKYGKLFAKWTQKELKPDAKELCVGGSTVFHVLCICGMWTGITSLSDTEL